MTVRLPELLAAYLAAANTAPVAGLGPAIHVLKMAPNEERKTWVPGTRPGTGYFGVFLHDTHTLFRAISWRAMMMRWSSLVPSPITSKGASR